ncbi:Sfb3p KNAG_0B04350 [Huiozyma naganishii CBS 8797]|uniref:VWFA domain-containing protein n=1 Tax=Huiozyma naganishii (strain ATCC MYA-139 / BCRC 22969 / CBS 8797 / KCTC 17520 / NBRC 10181 / NCYC 3082 / Yp74L-3) TaxID=1071383 RepID=J7S3R8_HUIN7|nr:hypothetical protein KNAG_0B04350 [Kazachstania naganishii CBS 8797]CCK68869.1 hypothetical protein KNAG_0B04350 [Kazachstania naganishii CBS 8797]
MSEGDLAAGISSLSLDQTGPVPHNFKKHRRPNRAFHNLNSANPTLNDLPSFPGMPVHGRTSSWTGASQSASGSPFIQPQSFTPRQFDASQFPAPGSPYVGNGVPPSPGFNTASEQFMVPAGPGASTPTPNASFSPVYEESNYNTSHIIATQRWEEQLLYLQKMYQTIKDLNVPLPTTEFYCKDQSKCDPRFMSVSMYALPEDSHLRSATKLPIGLTVQPFAQTLPEEPVPIVKSITNMVLNDGSEDLKEPIRCMRCRTYLNPGFQIGYDGNACCNICNVKMKLSMEEFGNGVIDGQGGLDRLETSFGTVDFLVPRQYNATKDAAPLPLHYVFLIDTSLLANENGSSLAVVEAVRNSIEYISENQENCKIAIIAYDNKLKFYKLIPELESAQEYIVNDLQDVFLPFYNGLFTKPKDSMKVINDTLRKISDFIVADKYSQVPHACYGTALEAAKLALSTVTGGQGGKIVCSLNSLPTLGKGNLQLKKDDALKKHVKCDNEFYNQIADQLMRSYISLDLYVTGAGFIDMASVAKPVEKTSGMLRYYPHFRSDHDEFLLVNDMVSNIAKIVGYQGLLKVRCSAGLSVESYYMDAIDYSDREPMIPVLTKDTTVDVLFKYDEKLKAGKDMYYQTAMLYTDIHGVRKVRSINTSSRVSKNIREIFKYVNQTAVLRIMIKDIIRTLGNCDFPAIRKVIDDKLVDILTQYRALISGNSSSQLVLPDALRTLPMYMLSFEKSALMRPNMQSTRGNERIFDLMKYSMFDSAKLSFKLYPQIIPFHEMLEETDLMFYDTNERLLQVSPTTIPNLSVRDGHASLMNGGCYFVFDGTHIYLWFNENTNKMLLQDLLGIDPSLPTASITLAGGYLPECGTSINEKARNIVKYWSHITAQPTIPLILLRPNIDQYYSSTMTNILCEDKSMNLIEDYDNYLINLHRKIQERLAKDDFVKVSTSSGSSLGKGHEQFHQKFVQF